MRSQEAPAGAQTPPALPTESEQHLLEGGIREYTMPPSEEKPGDERAQEQQPIESSPDYQHAAEQPMSSIESPDHMMKHNMTSEDE